MTWPNPKLTYVCDCALCRRSRRLRYIQDVLRRAGDEPSADWLAVIYDHLLDLELDAEMERAAR